MNALSERRCLHHAHREAVGCCTGCHRYFCRECVTEHDDKLLCAACLAERTRATPSHGFRIGLFADALRVILYLLTAWFLFFAILQTVRRVPVAVFDHNAINRDNDDEAAR